MRNEDYYLTQEQAANMLGAKSVDTFRKFARRMGLQAYKPCGKLLYKKSDIIQAVEVEPWQQSNLEGKAGNSTGQKTDNNTADPLAQFRTKKPSARKSRKNTN